jgi:hypothetical protein
MAFIHQMFDYFIIKPVAAKVAHEESHEDAKEKSYYGSEINYHQFLLLFNKNFC